RRREQLRLPEPDVNDEAEHGQGERDVQQGHGLERLDELLWSQVHQGDERQDSRNTEHRRFAYGWPTASRPGRTIAESLIGTLRRLATSITPRSGRRSVTGQRERKGRASASLAGLSVGTSTARARQQGRRCGYWRSPKFFPMHSTRTTRPTIGSSSRSS